ncbi:MAG TPA: cell wall hydrolase [Caulobacteraceae bacterium]
MKPQRITAVLAAVALAACAHVSATSVSAVHLKALAALAGSFSPEGQARIERTMDPAMRVLASRLESGVRADRWARADGWAVLDLTRAPSLGFAALSPDEAERVNSYLPDTGEPQTPATPFVLKAASAERERAIFCLTQAIYYEAALQPTPGQEAVAQTIVNRMRHPAFPKSICGVVYQGSQQVTGCQYSFTCDGSRDRPPAAIFWARARAVAVQALDGFVMREVGLATHYHADYVFPRWGPTMVKIRQIGAHIFYRFPGPAGASDSFQQRYNGGELRVSMEGPSPEAILAARAAGTPSDDGQGPDETFTMIDPSAPGGLRQRVAGEVIFGRRVPTKDEIARINAALESVAGPLVKPGQAVQPLPAPSPPAKQPPPVTSSAPKTSMPAAPKAVPPVQPNPAGK